MAASLYDQLYATAFAGGINYASDTIKAMLCTSTYVPDAQAHNFKSDVTNEVTGTGYTAGGNALASKTATLTVANSWTVSRANSTAYNVGDVVRPATGNGFLYQVITAGTSGATIPTYTTTVGTTFTDGGVTWVCKGRSVLALDAADPAWTTATITARTIVFYKDTGTAATSPLIAYDTFTADVSSTGATFTYTVATFGFALIFMD